MIKTNSPRVWILSDEQKKYLSQTIFFQNALWYVLWYAAVPPRKGGKASAWKLLSPELTNGKQGKEGSWFPRRPSLYIVENVVYFSGNNFTLHAMLHTVEYELWVDNNPFNTAAPQHVKQKEE